MKCHSYQICVLDVNLSCPTHILFEPSHTAPFDACPTGNSSMGRQTVEVAPYSGACRTCPYPSHIFPNFHQRVCTNSLHLPVPMLMPRHHLRALQKWQNTMTSAQSPCEAGLGRVAICKENNKSRCPNDCTGLGTHQHFTITQSCKHLQTMGQHLSIHTNFNNINYKISTSSFAHLITHPSHISVPSPQLAEFPNSKPNRKREIGQASSIAMDNFPRPWPLQIVVQKAEKWWLNER